MNYTIKYLKSKGQDCSILRSPKNDSTKISLKRATTAIRIYGAREAHWEGLVLPDSGLVSGEVFEANNMTFITQSVNKDPASGAFTWFAVTVNAVLEHWRFEEKVDDYGNITEECTDKGDIYAYGEIVTAELRQREVGLLEGTLYLFQIPQSAGVQILDRIVYEGKNYQVNSLDSVAMPGISRLQCGADQRPQTMKAIIPDPEEPEEPENGEGNGNDDDNDDEIED